MSDRRDDIVARLALEQHLVAPRQLAEALRIQHGAAEAGLPESLQHVLVARGMISDTRAGELTKAVAHETGEERLVGEYEVVARLGRGGMGAVYKARDLRTGRVVALKILPPSMADDETIVRFRREAEIARALRHENIVRYVEFGRDRVRHVYYCAFEFVEGESLGCALDRDGPVNVRRAVSIVRQIARALAHAHAHGLVHRDVKPDNIIVTASGKAMLLDLGVARHVADDNTRVTHEGCFVGSPLYASPEQARGSSSVDVRSDIYSLGATLYEMLTGRPPFEGDNPLSVLQMHLSKRAPCPCRVNPDVPRDMCLVIGKMMARKASHRYQSPRELVRDLERVLCGEPVAIDDRELARSVLKCAPDHTPAHGFRAAARGRRERHPRRSPVPRTRSHAPVTWRDRIRRIARAVLGAAGLL